MYQDETCQSMVATEQLSIDEFLNLLGRRLRLHRNRKKMTRKTLAQISGVSERYLAQMEAGRGNMSIALLRKVSAAMQIPLDELVSEPSPKATEYT